MISKFLDEWMTIVEIIINFFILLSVFWGVTMTGFLEELERKPELEVTPLLQLSTVAYHIT